MMQRIQRFLEHVPPLHRVASKGYLLYRATRGRFEGTRMREREWSQRSRAAVLKEHVGTLYRPHRQYLVERIGAFAPISTALEVGCSAGANLYLLRQRFPDAELRGVDINGAAIEVGRAWFAQEGIQSIHLSLGRADDLSQFPDGAFDVVFTHAVLLYIGPDKIQKVVLDMLRVARKALILSEWHEPAAGDRDRCGLGLLHRDHWKRDYVALLRQFVHEDQIEVTRAPAAIWPEDAPAWRELGTIVEVRKTAR